MSRFEIYTVYLFCSGLDNEDEGQSAPLIETMNFTSTRRTSSRYAGETGTRKPPAQRIGEVCLCAAPAHVHTARTAFAAGAQLVAYTQPALRTGLMAPAWCISRRAILDLTPAWQRRRSMWVARRGVRHVGRHVALRCRCLCPSGQPLLHGVYFGVRVTFCPKHACRSWRHTGVIGDLEVQRGICR